MRHRGHTFLTSGIAMEDTNDKVVQKTSSSKRHLYATVALATMQSFLMGYSFVVLNPALVSGNSNSSEACYNGEDPSCPPGSIYRSMLLSTIDASVATSILIAGALVGAFACSRPMDWYGRRSTLLYNCSLYLVGTSLTCIGTKPTLFCGRLITGIGAGVSSVCVPILLSEIASEEDRGSITTLHQVLVTFAILVGGVVSLGVVGNVEQGWRYCEAIAFAPTIAVLICMNYLLESPKWLVGKGRKDEAITILSLVRDPSVHNVNQEMDELVAESDVQANSADVTWKEVVSNPKPIVIGSLLMFIQAFTGINSVVFYSTTIFGFAGFHDAILGTALFGIVNFLSTIFSAMTIDKFGRKVLLLTGTCIMCFSLVALSTALLAGSGTTIGIIAVIAVLTYVVGFAIGLGAVVWVMLSELMRSRIRGKAVSLFLSINWCSNFVIGMCSLLAIDGLGGVQENMSDEEASEAKKKGVAYLYLIFAAISFTSAIYIYFQVPETKGKSPEDFVDEDARLGLLAFNHDKEETRAIQTA